MRLIPEQFPQERRRNPKRRSEARVFDALARSGHQGCAIYEWGAAEQPHQLDFALWLTDVGRFAIEVKGGRYTLETDRWHLHTRRGAEAKSSPLDQVTVAARDLRREIRQQTGRRVGIIPLVVFTSMEPDPAIERCARRNRVQVIWGTARLLEALEALARRVGERHPPGPGQVRREVKAVTGGCDRPDPGRACGFTDITIRRVGLLTVEQELEVWPSSNRRQAHST